MLTILLSTHSLGTNGIRVACFATWRGTGDQGAQAGKYAGVTLAEGRVR
jgi:hypothetical protein